MPPTTGVKIKLGPKQYTLRYTQPALEKLEGHRGGEALLDTFERAAKFQASAIAALIWAGLLHAEPELTPEATSARIEPPYKPLIEAMIEALKPWLDMEDDLGKGGPLQLSG